MGSFTLIIGGARSGKSAFALKRGKAFGGRRIFVATARSTDAEMETRIRMHKSQRGAEWETREEPLDLVSLLSSLPANTDVVVVDCITLFLSNLMVEKRYSESDLMREMDLLGSALGKCPFPVIAVTNEVGTGLVPADVLGRRFRDISGMVNQHLAREAEEVFLMAAGIPLCIKGGEER